MYPAPSLSRPCPRTGQACDLHRARLRPLPRRASILPTACRTSAQQSQCLHRYFIRSTGLSSERRSSSPMTTRRNPARSYSDHIFSVSSQCRRTHRPSDILPSFSDPTLPIARPGTPTVRRMHGGGQDLSGTIAQRLNLEHEIHHTVSKLCILGFEPLKWSLIH